MLRGKILLALAMSGCIPSIKSVFVDMSYPKKSPQSVPRNMTMSVDAAVAPSLLVGFERPREAGRCIAELANDANTLRSMWSYGQCLTAGGVRAACLSRFPFVEATGASAPAPPFTLHFGCATQPATELDRIQLALALDDASVEIVTYEMAADGPQAIHGPLPAELTVPFGQAMKHAASLLAADPTDRHDTSLPALSLSGGAANGAFVAGFMYALLSTREKARLYGNPAQQRLLDGEQFGGTFGSSVGSLIGLPLDLYFTPAVPGPALGPALDGCIQGGSGPVAGRPDRKLQDCALAQLERNFVANEWDLLCARKGLATDLLQPDAKSLLKFDPLEHNRIDPFLQKFGGLTRGNAFVRTAVSADLAQGVLGSVDERACLLPGMDADRCDREAILASVSEPVLAPARSRLYTGLNGPAGEEGTWLDGGLQSVNPAARAVSYTSGKVLALNTFRALGTPVTHIQGLTPIVLGTVISIGTRMIGWEISYAGLEQHRRHMQACELGRLVGSFLLCPQSELEVVGPAMGAPRLLSVSVPDDIAPAALFASGYTFDPVVMRGLFLWGERSMLRARRDVLGFLGWCVPSALERADVPCPGGEGVSAAFGQVLRDHERRVTAEIDSYRQYEAPGAWQKHLDERRSTVKDKLQTCAGD
jgi:hypothetical protein